jgi:hypothetical protein
MVMIYVSTNIHMPGSSGLLVIATSAQAEESVRTTTMLLIYIVQS